MFTLILKTTNACNLDCEYCSLGKQTDYSKMSKSLFFDILEYTYLLGNKQINVILHGGEPTLIDIDIYTNVITQIKQKYNDLDLTLSMQTNGFLLNDKIIDFCKNFDVGLGVSVDGGASIHDKQRHTKNGSGSFEIIKENILRYRSENILVSTLMVLTKNAFNESFEFLDFFNEHHINIKINPLLNYGNALENQGLILQEGDYANYLIKLFEYAVENNIQISIAPLTKIINAIIHDTPINGCNFNKACHKNFLCIDYTGDIYPCGKFSDLKEYKLGNVSDKNYDIMNHEILKTLTLRTTTNIPAKCKKCKYLNLCNSGCNGESIINNSDTPFNCTDYKILFNYFYSDGLDLIKKQLIEQKKQLLKQMEVN